MGRVNTKQDMKMINDGIEELTKRDYFAGIIFAELLKIENINDITILDFEHILQKAYDIVDEI